MSKPDELAYYVAVTDAAVRRVIAVWGACVRNGAVDEALVGRICGLGDHQAQRAIATCLTMGLVSVDGAVSPEARAAIARELKS